MESGLEYELLLGRDREPDVAWLVPQPCRLNFRSDSGRSRSHVPDLLELHTDGSVVLWDARPQDRRDGRFEEAVRATSSACASVGWSHKVFGGHDRVLRYALRWLAAYRMPRPWHQPARWHLQDVLADGGTVATVLTADQGGGHLVQTMWHLLWAGELVTDLTQPLTASSALSWSHAISCSGTERPSKP